MEDLSLILEVNGLFEPFYPYVARQIAEVYGRQDGVALELGPYAPGISMALARLCPDLSMVVADDTPGILQYFRERVAQAGLSHRIAVREGNKLRMPFPEGAFDLVYFRGALFFWEGQVDILREAYRVLRAGGVAVLGGGFGADTPDWLIDLLLDRSRELNRRLGKRVISEAELHALLREAGLEHCSRLDQRHGLWVVLRKPQTPPAL